MKKLFRFFFKVIFYLVVLGITIPITLILPLKKLEPLTTSIQIQRRVSALAEFRNYRKEYYWVPLGSISRNLQAAVVASEDGKFFEHYGVDLEEAEKAYEAGAKGKRKRGASTITMQLVKNLYLWEGYTLYDTAVRKGIEVYLSLWMELLLPKDRILEIYLNVIEWGDGVYGAEAAARKYYKRTAKDVTRGQAAHMAAALPSPLRHKPTDGSRFIEGRAAKIVRWI